MICSLRCAEFGYVPRYRFFCAEISSEMRFARPVPKLSTYPLQIGMSIFFLSIFTLRVSSRSSVKFTWASVFLLENFGSSGPRCNHWEQAKHSFHWTRAGCWLAACRSWFVLQERSTRLYCALGGCNPSEHFHFSPQAASSGQKCFRSGNLIIGVCILWESVTYIKCFVCIKV